MDESITDKLYCLKRDAAYAACNGLPYQSVEHTLRNCVTERDQKRYQPTLRNRDDPDEPDESGSDASDDDDSGSDASDASDDGDRQQRGLAALLMASQSEGDRNLPAEYRKKQNKLMRAAKAAADAIRRATTKRRGTLTTRNYLVSKLKPTITEIYDYLKSKHSDWSKRSSVKPTKEDYEFIFNRMKNRYFDVGVSFTYDSRLLDNKELVFYWTYDPDARVEIKLFQIIKLLHTVDDVQVKLVVYLENLSEKYKIETDPDEKRSIVDEQQRCIDAMEERKKVIEQHFKDKTNWIVADEDTDASGFDVTTEPDDLVRGA